MGADPALQFGITASKTINCLPRCFYQGILSYFLMSPK
jgi:hypothetical protein